MKINDTPVRTSKNYGMNNINIPDELLSHETKKFDNFSTNVAFEKINSLLPQKPLSQSLEEELKSPNLECDIQIDKDTVTPIKLDFDFDENNDVLIEKVNITVEENIKAQVVIMYKSTSKSYHNGFVNVHLKENSKLSVVLVNEFNSGSINLLSFESTLENNADFDLKLVDFGAKYSVISNYSSFVGKDAKADLKTLYIGSEDNKTDFNILADLYGERSDVNIECVGALFGTAEKSFKGTIDFKKGCKKSKGNESELCMLISKNSKSKALPMLLCTEEDVDGSHSTAVGKVGEKELFYIMSRGFSKEEAMKIVIKAKFNRILNDIFDENLKDKIINLIDGKIDYEN